MATPEKRCGQWNGGECQHWNFECVVHPLKPCFDCGKPASKYSCVSGSRPPNYFCQDCTFERMKCGCIDWERQDPWRCTKHRSKGERKEDEWTISELWLDHFSFLE
jgi:hypothetical protein